MTEERRDICCCFVVLRFCMGELIKRLVFLTPHSPCVTGHGGKCCRKGKHSRSPLLGIDQSTSRQLMLRFSTQNQSQHNKDDT